MNILGIIFIVVTLTCIQDSTGNFWANRKVNCGVSLWSDWTSWTAPAPGGTRTRTRIIVRNPRNGGNTCPSLTETEQRSVSGDPWDRQDVPKKFHNKFMTGTTHVYSFIDGVNTRTPPGRLGQIGAVDGASSANRTIITLLARDLLFMIDMSGSISERHWTLTKRKLADLIGRLCGSIGPGRNNNRIAIVTFSSRVILNFNYKTHWTVASVREAILGMPQDPGLTCTGDAFEYARNYMFEPDTGMRSAAESVKEVLVLTDGHSNCGAELPREIRRLKVKAFVFALAIGEFENINKAEIESMVSRPLIDHIFSLGHFVEFRRMVDAIMEYDGKCVPFELSK